MVKIWKQVEDDRKKPIRVIGLVGWGAMARYALGMLSLTAGVRKISRQTGIAAGVVTMPFAEAAIDVDSVADLDLVRAIVARGAAKARARRSSRGGEQARQRRARTASAPAKPR